MTIVHPSKCFLLGFFFFWFGIVSCESSFKIDKKVALFCLFSFFLVIIITLFLDKDMNPMLGGSSPSTFFLQYNKYFNLFISFLLIPFAIHSLNYKSNNNFDRFLGRMSYPLYLGHWITIIYIIRFADLNFKERLLSVLFPCALTYFACFFITKYYDSLFENLRKKIN
jgi:peptidoglycan/LPS O-acetylase OafA/YrhL